MMLKSGKLGLGARQLVGCCAMVVAQADPMSSVEFDCHPARSTSLPFGIRNFLVEVGSYQVLLLEESVVWNVLQSDPDRYVPIRYCPGAASWNVLLWRE